MVRVSFCLSGQRLFYSIWLEFMFGKTIGYLAVVVETFPSEDGHVRSVKVRTGNGTQNCIERPIYKRVVLLEVFTLYVLILYIINQY